MGERVVVAVNFLVLSSLFPMYICRHSHTPLQPSMHFFCPQSEPHKYLNFDWILYSSSSNLLRTASVAAEITIFCSIIDVAPLSCADMSLLCWNFVFLVLVRCLDIVPGFGVQLQFCLLMVMSVFCLG